jgi:hypothetical protein
VVVFLRSDSHLKLTCLPIAPLHEIVQGEVSIVGMNDALTLPAVCRLIITDLAVAVDGSGLDSYWRSADHLLQQLHDLAARAGWQLSQLNANFK